MIRAGYLADTHCHIHSSDYPLNPSEVLTSALDSGVSRIITMGCDPADSELAVRYALEQGQPEGLILRAGVGIYPHQAGDFRSSDIDRLQTLIDANRRVIAAVGEVGLDYCYDTVSPTKQLESLEALIQLSLDNALPLSLHVRSGDYGDAFADFWALLGNFPHGVSGVVHSFTDSQANLEQVLKRDLSIGVNGIITFNRDPTLAEVYRTAPLDRVVLETDSPYLAPVPYRGKTNQPKHIRQIAERLAEVRGVSLAQLVEVVASNVERIFHLSTTDAGLG